MCISMSAAVSVTAMSSDFHSVGVSEPSHRRASRHHCGGRHGGWHGSRQKKIVLGWHAIAHGGRQGARHSSRHGGRQKKWFLTDMDFIIIFIFVYFRFCVFSAPFTVNWAEIIQRADFEYFPPHLPWIGWKLQFPPRRRAVFTWGPKSGWIRNVHVVVIMFNSLCRPRHRHSIWLQLPICWIPGDRNLSFE